jgi:fatty acid desaturase
MKQKSSKNENKLVFKYFITGTGGMIAMAIALILFEKVGWSTNTSSGIMFLPWMIAGALAVPVAYKQGLKDGSEK